MGHSIGYTHIENDTNGDCFIEGNEVNDKNSLMRIYIDNESVDRNNLFTSSDIVAHINLYPHRSGNNFKYQVSYKGKRNSHFYWFYEKKNIELYYFISVVGMLIPREGDSIYG